MSAEPTNRALTCVVCGEPITEAAGEVPVFVGDELDIGDYDGDAYHLNACEGDVFETVYAEVDPA